jgi:hypothetical protein
MGWLAWLKRRKNSSGDPRLDEWRERWRSACATPDSDQIAALAATLRDLGLPDEDIEIEREMLAGLEHLTALRAAVASSELPVVETGHRIVGHDTCHFSAPTSMPDEPSQPTGRLILTSARAIFVGGAKSVTLPWHAVAEVLDQERDVVLVRHDRETHYRIRCNIYDDSLTAAFLARTLAARHRRARAVPQS